MLKKSRRRRQRNMKPEAVRRSAGHPSTRHRFASFSVGFPLDSLRLSWSSAGLADDTHLKTWQWLAVMSSFVRAIGTSLAERLAGLPLESFGFRGARPGWRVTTSAQDVSRGLLPTLPG